MAGNSVSPQAGFPTDFKEQVRARTDLVELVGESVALTSRGGHDFVGLCPFHDDHRPSFHVYRDRQTYRCWVCDQGGDCFSFVMQYDRVSFREALELLAERAGLELPATVRRESPEQKDHRARLLEIIAWAETLCHRFLLEDGSAQPARDYLESRGFSPATIETFRLGYHPPEWDWLLSRGRLKKYTPQEMVQAGLAGERESGGWYDRALFFGRVLFPIRDFRGRPVAFGGRVLPGMQTGEGAKYLNSTESELFAKSHLLYGFDQSREAIRNTKTVVVMEGYTDCIAAHQAGVKNVVSTLGTALNDNHVRNLKRFAQKVILVFDGDKAGQDATERAITKFLAQDVDLRILTLPEGLDPADFLSEHGTEAFQQLADEAPEAWNYKLASCVRRVGVDSVDAKNRVLAEMVGAMAEAPQLAGSSREQFIISRLAQQLMTAERTVLQALKAARSHTNAKNTSPAAQPRQSIREAAASPHPLALNPLPSDIVERELLEIVFAMPAVVERLQREIGPEALRNTALRSLLQLCFDLAERGDDPSFDKVTAALEDPELKRLAIRIDDDARQKRIRQLLADDRPFTTNNGTRTTYVDYVIGQLRLRCERQFQEPLKGQLTGLAAATPDGPVTPTDKQEQLRLLEKVQKFHARRTNS